MFELDAAHRITVIQGQLFEEGKFKKSLDLSEIAYLYSLLEELAQELRDQYSYKERAKRESELIKELGA